MPLYQPGTFTVPTTLFIPGVGAVTFNNPTGPAVNSGLATTLAGGSTAAAAAAGSVAGNVGPAGILDNALFSSLVQDGVAFDVSDPSKRLPPGWTITNKGATQNLPIEVVSPTVYKPLKPFINWPGVVYPISLDYTNSHSTSPGIATLRMNPQPDLPETFGNLTFGDSLRRPITLRDCVVLNYDSSVSAGGAYCTLTIADRRWKWTQGYTIDGEYNRMDDHGNLVPWTVRSATELAEICLKRLGEKKYTIAFPPGLKRSQAARYANYLRAGQRFPLTTANPYVQWSVIPAALALQDLADRFGCRVMYDPITDRILVLPLGYGRGLPLTGTSVAQCSQGLDSARTPEYVCVEGAPVKFQMHVALEPVGIEWTKEYYENIEFLSYAPDRFADDDKKWNRNPPPSFPLVKPTDRLEYTEAKQLAAQGVYRMYRVMERSDDLKQWHPEGIDVEGGAGIKVPGLLDDICVGPNPANRRGGTGTKFDAGKSLLYSAVLGTVDGAYTAPSYNPTQQPKPKLGNIEQAKFYRTAYRQQLVPTPFKVDQIVPRPLRDTDIAVEGARLNPDGTLPDYYNGYSRDRPAECFGSYFAGCSNVKYRLTTQNVTDRRVYLNFTVDTTQQLIIFERPLYFLGGDSNKIFQPAKDLYIETGFLVLDEETNAPVRCKYWVKMGGNAPGIHETHEDVITHIVGKYTTHHRTSADGAALSSTLDYSKRTDPLIGYRVDDFGDGKKRADYYLTGMKRRFQKWQSQSVTYNGCMGFSPSGLVRQVRWNIGASITTTVGVNTEFSPTVPPYPARKLEELMTPNAQAVQMNMQSSPVKLLTLVGGMKVK